MGRPARALPRDLQAERWRKTLKVQGLADGALRGTSAPVAGGPGWIEAEGLDIEPQDVSRTTPIR